MDPLRPDATARARSPEPRREERRERMRARSSSDAGLTARVHSSTNLRTSTHLSPPLTSQGLTTTIPDAALCAAPGDTVTQYEAWRNATETRVRTHSASRTDDSRRSRRDRYEGSIRVAGVDDHRDWHSSYSRNYEPSLAHHHSPRSDVPQAAFSAAFDPFNVLSGDPSQVGARRPSLERSNR